MTWRKIISYTHKHTLPCGINLHVVHLKEEQAEWHKDKKIVHEFVFLLSTIATPYIL